MRAHMNGNQIHEQIRDSESEAFELAKSNDLFPLLPARAPSVFQTLSETVAVYEYDRRPTDVTRQTRGMGTV